MSNGHYRYKKESKIFSFLKEIIKLPMVLSLRILKTPKRFFFRNQAYEYFIHSYNTTWLNERIIEIPIILSFIEPKKRILEIGNVLSHYINIDWDVLDKFEKAEGVINEDVVDYIPDEKYDLIISVSTLEHVGFDDNKKDDNKISKALDNLRHNCLKTKGEIVVTLPIGYNKKMDEKLFANQLGFNEACFLRRISKNNEWEKIKKKDAVRGQYNYPYPAANVVCIGTIYR